MGLYDTATSYLQFLVQEITGLDVSRGLVDIFAVAFLVVALFLSVLLNVRDFKRKRMRDKDRGSG